MSKSRATRFLATLHPLPVTSSTSSPGAHLILRVPPPRVLGPCASCRARDPRHQRNRSQVPYAYPQNERAEIRAVNESASRGVHAPRLRYFHVKCGTLQAIDVSFRICAYKRCTNTSSSDNRHMGWDRFVIIRIVSVFHPTDHLCHAQNLSCKTVHLTQNSK